MSEEVTGVFMEDGGRTYLTAAFEDEYKAEEYIEETVEQMYDDAVEAELDIEMPEPDRDHFIGRFWTDPILRSEVQYDLIDRGMAQPV
jgi:hypothetical protein